MTATGVLRRLLDERGAWWDYGIRGASTTRFSVNGVDLTFTPMRDGLVCSTILTPEQAIAATLGSCNCSCNCPNSERTETCHDLGGTDENDEQVFNCSECGCVLSLYDRDGTNTLCTHFIYDYPRYCPNCGRKVVAQ